MRIHFPGPHSPFGLVHLFAACTIGCCSRILAGFLRSRLYPSSRLRFMSKATSARGGGDPHSPGDRYGRRLLLSFSLTMIYIHPYVRTRNRPPSRYILSRYMKGYRGHILCWCTGTMERYTACPRLRINLMKQVYGNCAMKYIAILIMVLVPLIFGIASYYGLRFVSRKLKRRNRG